MLLRITAVEIDAFQFRSFESCFCKITAVEINVFYFGFRESCFCEIRMIKLHDLICAPERLHSVKFEL
jgi:hypothetical protein